MPNKPAAKKYLRVSKNKHKRNLVIKNKLKAIIKKTKEALEDSKAASKIEELLKEAVKTIERAAQKKVIKKNAAARKKRVLFKKLRKVGKK